MSLSLAFTAPTGLAAFAGSGGAQLSLSLDATVRETHLAESEVTEHPVESGANISDHVRPKSDELTIEGVITDYPFNKNSNGDFLSSTTQTVGDIDLVLVGNKVQPGRAKDIYQQLKALKTAGTLITLTTTLEVYQNMVISSLQPIADKDSSGAVKLTMHLRQIRIVQSQSVQLQRAAVPAAQPKLDQGKKTGLPVDAATSQKTVIHRLGLGLVDLGKKALNIP